MKQFKIGLIALLIATVAVPLQAERAAFRDQFYFSPLIGYHIFDNERGFDNAISYGATVGKMLHPNWGIEGQFLFSRTRNDALSRHFNVFHYNIDLLYQFLPLDNLGIFVTFGFGSSWGSPALPGADLPLGMHFGAGVRHMLTNWIGWRLQYSDYFLIPNSTQTFNDALVQLALEFHAPISPYPHQKRSRDDDSDGVHNFADQCPKTPRNVTVDDMGCPVDEDRDGVVNQYDHCPKTPIGTKVDANGCPVFVKEQTKRDLSDADGDGVPDDRDHCPKTGADEFVDLGGCTIPIGSAPFQFNSSKISEQMFAEIQRAAQYLREHPDSRIKIIGHTDNIGPDAYNLELSKQRAQEVKAILVEQFNVPADRILTDGRGSTKPVATNATEKGRAQNRRVEFIRMKGQTE